jgi:Fe-S cluster biosynthesis and repair protein YggX
MLSQCQLSFWQLKQDMLVRFKQDVTLNMCRNELRDYVEVRSYLFFFLSSIYLLFCCIR